MSEGAVLVTGVAGQIGGHLVEEFLKEGWTVCGLDQRFPAEVTRAGFSFQECDLADGAETERKIGVFHERVGAFDAVINCAGVIANSPLISFVEGRLRRHDFELWDRVVSSSLSSAFYVTASTVSKMVESGKKGVIINISSICSRGNAGQTAYSAAKAGLNGLTMASAKELGPMGIRVVSLAPGYFDTTSTRRHVSAGKLREIEGAVPLRRLGQVQELTSAIQFILENQYVNGTIIELDGGLVL